MIRNVLSVIAGYMVFAVSSVMLFNLTGQPPHQDAPLSFKLITLFYGLFFAIVAGWVLQLIARQQTLRLNYVLAAVIFLLAGISMLTSGGSHWTQLFAMFIFAPASVLGGYLKLLLVKKD
ncbi:hypothetical protein FFF34_001760 [Inquilinus sp. KBS0705]|nr:hypothetical protein FFF34_001760 [Inquilinus sp. KBS0705]